MKKETTSSKVRSLLARGFSAAQITEKLKCHPNLPHSIKHYDKVKEEKASGELPLDHPLFATAPIKKEGKSVKYDKGTGANAMQVGGDHYSKYGDFQPWDAWHLWNLNGFQAAILKYVVRYRDKNGLQDLDKAKHLLDKLIEVETNKEK